jgi:hypothetical protein
MSLTSSAVKAAFFFISEANDGTKWFQYAAATARFIPVAR